jgi:tetratricopeptide (TPR) repeat protein
MRAKIKILAIICLAIFAITAAEAKDPEFLSKQKKAVITISVYDRSGSEIISGSGFVADRDGIIATGCKIILAWLDDVGNSLIVKTEDGARYPINKLFVFNRKQDIALFDIKAERVYAAEMPKDYRHADYIKKQIAIYKKSLPVVPASPAEKPRIETAKAVEKPIERPAEIPKPQKPEKKPDEAETHLSRGLSYEESKKYQDAIDAYNKALKLKPDYAEAYIRLGASYYKLGKYQEAADSYKHAIRLRPDSSAYNKLGTLYMIMGEYDNAVDILKQALNIEPYNPATRFNIGMAYFLSGNKEAALEEYILLNKIDTKRAEDLFEMLYR